MTGLNCPVCGSGEVGDCVCPQPNVPASSGAREALVERLAEAIGPRMTRHLPGVVRKAITEAMPIIDEHVAAEVEAAVSVVRAEADRLREQRDELDGLLDDNQEDFWQERSDHWLRRAEAAESERDALREKVAKVEALCVKCSWTPARPTTPDQTGGES